MGVRWASTLSIATIAAIVNAVDTVAIITPPINLAIDSAQVMLFWYIPFTVGTSTTAVSVRLRRGALVSSPLINQVSALTAVAGNVMLLSGVYVDSPGVVAEQQYCISIVQTGGTGNGTSTDGCMLAMCL